MIECPIYIIGKGNLGWHLNQLFEQNNISLNGWYSSRSSFSEIVLLEGSMIFLTVSDDVLEEQVLTLINLQKNLKIIYCSGSIDLVSKYPNMVACWYPLYSFTKGLQVNWQNVPLFIESFNIDLTDCINSLNDKLNLNYHSITAEQRQKLHLSAVFINNFTTACAIAASEILNDDVLFGHLIPILSQTVEKINVSQANLKEIQTGPAKRGDDLVIQRHIELLNTLVLENQLYQSITQYIKQKLK